MVGSYFDARLYIHLCQYYNMVKSAHHHGECTNMSFAVKRHCLTQSSTSDVVFEEPIRGVVKSCTRCSSFSSSLSNLCARYRGQQQHVIMKRFLSQEDTVPKVSKHHFCWREPCPKCGTVSLAEAYLAALSADACGMCDQPCRFCESVARMIYIDAYDDVLGRMGFSVEELTSGHTSVVNASSLRYMSHPLYVSFDTHTEELNVEKHELSTSNIASVWAAIARLVYANLDGCIRRSHPSGTMCWCTLALDTGLCLADLHKLHDNVELIMSSDVTLFSLFTTTSKKSGSSLKQAFMMKTTEWTPCAIVMNRLLIRTQVTDACIAKYNCHNWESVQRGLSNHHDTMTRHSIHAGRTTSRHWSTLMRRTLT